MNNNKPLIPYITSLTYHASIILACCLFYFLPIHAVAEATSLDDEINALIQQIDNEKSRINTTLLTRQDLERHSSAITQFETANTQHRNQELHAAIKSYKAALSKLNAINKNIDKAHRRSIEQGLDAIKSGNSHIATSAFNRALLFRHGSEEALVGLGRANILNEVLEHITKGDQARRKGDLEIAINAYNDALALDPETTLAQSKLETIQRLKVKQKFFLHMENGHKALNEKRFASAAKQFELAIKIDPNSTEAQSRFKFALREQKRNIILDHLGEALSAQQEKQWQVAIDHFNSALALDPNLETAQTGKQYSLDQLEK